MPIKYPPQGQWVQTYSVDFTALTALDLTSSGDDDYTVDNKSVTVIGSANADAIDVTPGEGIVVAYDGAGSGAEIVLGWLPAALWGAGSEIYRRRVAIQMNYTPAQQNQRAGLRWASSTGAESPGANLFNSQGAAAVNLTMNRNGANGRVVQPGGVTRCLELEWIGGYVQGRYQLAAGIPGGGSGTIHTRITPEDLEANGTSAFDYTDDLIAFIVKDFSGATYTATLERMVAEVFI